MTFGQQALSRLAEWGGFIDSPRWLEIDADRHRMRIEVRTADRLSASLGEIRLEAKQPLALAAEDLRAWGDRIAARVRYLLEAIQTVELDRPHGRLLLRSAPPEKKPDGTFYYELVLERSGGLQFVRRRFDAKQRAREIEELRCTHEALEKLVEDLVATAP